MLGARAPDRFEKKQERERSQEAEESKIVEVNVKVTAGCRTFSSIRIVFFVNPFA